MIFESFWPLALLCAVPVVIILYLLKPKGKDYRISSTLLWNTILRNQQSRTFLEKFIHNILMYLQILNKVLLVMALMSPNLQGKGQVGGHEILVLDISGSMQHDAGNGRTRMQEAVDRAKSIIASSQETAFSIVTNDLQGTDLLAARVKDRESLYEVLDRIHCHDGQGDLRSAENVVETLRNSVGESGDPAGEVVVLTDGNGAGNAVGFSEYFAARVFVMGDAVNNVANNFLSYAVIDAGSENEADNAAADRYGLADGETAGRLGQSRMIRCASSLTNYGDVDAAMEIGLYEGDKLLELKQITLGPGENRLCFFEDFVWQGNPLYSEISAVRFAGSDRGDSLAADNVAYVVPEETRELDAVYVGNGNTYIEKAYQAAVGKSLTKVKNENTMDIREGENTVFIYDAGEEHRLAGLVNGMLFGDDEMSAGAVEKVLLTASECDLTAGLSAFSVGVNKTKVYEVPDWGIGFLWAGEQCAGYYGEHDGVKRVVVGFDIRESDFPLKGEFPVFISNAIHFLGDTSLLAKHVYGAGEPVVFHPQADFDVSGLTAETQKAGLYEVRADDITEWYVVRFATESQSDGRVVAAGTGDEITYGTTSVKRYLRNGLLILILLLMAAEWILYVRQMRYRGRFYFAVRMTGVVLLILALVGVAVSRRNGMNTTIFLVDLSHSNEQNLSEMEEYLDKAIREMPGKNQYGIVTFGKNSMVEQFLTDENHFTQIMSLPDKEATNFEDALSRALAMMPSDGAGRVVILTDGRETKGDFTSMASALASGKVELLACVYETEQKQDAYVEKVELPGYLYQGDAYSMTVTVESNYETDAQIQIWFGSRQAECYEVHLGRGRNQFRFRQTVTEETMESFQVKVVAEGDACEENNSYYAYSMVQSPPKILVVSGMGEENGHFEELLRNANCNYNAVSAINAPTSLKGLLEYRSIVLNNVFLTDLPEGFLENVENYIKSYGGGLVCCGGDDSFALGGYRYSVLETLLPVEMELRGVNEIPAMAMIMVIDHSGSMSTDMGSNVTSLDLAITAAKVAVDGLRETDYVGVLTFDNEFSWVVEPVVASDREGIKAQIETIVDGGGTTIQPALWEALDKVLNCDVNIRHVILLTDGQGESSDYGKLMKDFQNADVTLSTVAVGDGSDTRLLERLAGSCGGRYYYSDMALDIPKIFAQEVFLRGDTYLQNGEFVLAVNGSHEITRGLFENGWPMIYGYVAATPKNAANVLIASQKDDPVLAVMQYGLGHTVSWNTDVTNRWTAEFAGQTDYVQLWRRIVDFSTGNDAIGEDLVEVKTSEGNIGVVYNAANYEERTEVEAVYTDPDGVSRTKPLHATAPGRYEAKLDTDMTGLYHLNVRRMDEGMVTNAVNAAAAVQYSEEYKFDISPASFKRFVERYGRILGPEENFWQQRKSRVKERYELAKWLILAATVWFVLDIALRRFHFVPRETKLYHKIKQWQERRTRSRFYTSYQLSGAETKKANRNQVPEKTDSSVKAPGIEAAKKKKRMKEQISEELDTSALLRKKDQRNR